MEFLNLVFGCVFPDDVRVTSFVEGFLVDVDGCIFAYGQRDGVARPGVELDHPVALL